MNAQTEPLDSDECPHGVPGGPCMQCYRAVYGTLDVVVARDLASAKADARPVDHAQATIGRLRVEVGLLASEVIRLRAETERLCTELADLQRLLAEAVERGDFLRNRAEKAEAEAARLQDLIPVAREAAP